MSAPTGALLDRLRSEGLAVPAGAPQESLESAEDVEYLADPQRTIAMFAERLEALHALDIGSIPGVDAPVRVTMDGVVAAAAQAVAGAADVRVDAAYAHMDRRELLEVLEAGVQRLDESDEDAPVLTHGAPGLDVLLCDRGAPVGFVYWDRMALADRHRDLAHVARSLTLSMGPMIVPAFFEHYGPPVDLVRLDWWLLALQFAPPRVRMQGDGR